MTHRITIALALLLSLPALAQDKKPAAVEDMEATQAAFRAAIKTGTKSLVTIETLGGTTAGSGKLFGGRRPPKRRGVFKQAIDASTTGVVVRADGLIATSLFNFNTKPQITTVILSDGREFVAKLVARDFSKGLALIKIDAKDLPVASPAKKVETGQWAIALGRAYASREPSAHFGIVSAVNRISGKAMQTDAPCSPVNYGGPLIDVAGDVLGIIVPLSTRGSGVGWYDSGIGFAVPLSDIQRDLPIMLKAKELHGGFLGVQPDTTHTGKGARIASIVPNSAAQKAGLTKGDIILKVDGEPVLNRFDMLFKLGRKYAGSTARLTLQRGGETFDQSVTLGKRPKRRPPRRPPGAPGGPPRPPR